LGKIVENEEKPLKNKVDKREVLKFGGFFVQRWDSWVWAGFARLESPRLASIINTLLKQKRFQALREFAEKAKKEHNIKVEIIQEED